MNINFKQQKGVSLVSLMIGMVISLMILAAVTVLFQNTYRVSNSLSNEAISDGALSTVLTELHTSTLSAGFGLTAGTHFVAGNDPTTGAAFAYWRFDLLDTNNVQCRGFIEDLSSGSLEYKWQKDDVGCDATGDLVDDFDWVDTGFTTVVASSSTSRMNFSTATAECWPYAEGLRSEYVVFTIEANSSDESEIIFQHDFCLVNLGS